MSPPQNAKIFPYALGSVGVVYGDIGTSPLYAFRETLSHLNEHGLAVSAGDVISLVSMLIWALIIVVTIKYVGFLMRADNNGEGGTLSLMALAQQATGGKYKTVFILGVCGAALFYGDSIITPAISVLSAVEGLKVVTPSLSNYVVPITIAILISLFAVQNRGTEKVAKAFGPIMVVWFSTLAIMGIIHIGDDLRILTAFNPIHAIAFATQYKGITLIVLGGVFLAVTGSEALYADMGHFGKTPIRLAWLCFVLPSLVLNYLGQGALVLQNPSFMQDPFFLMAPEWAALPLVILATVATVIASQAVITGAFSLTQQAVQLGLLPRMEIQHKSEEQAGQIYLPQINKMLLLGVLILVIMFRSSSNLASAYGIAVTGAMLVDTLLAFYVAWKVWHWKPWASALIIMPFLIVDITFFTANSLKIFEGGFVPLLLGAIMVAIMLTWVEGTKVLTQKTRRESIPLEEMDTILDSDSIHPIEGTAVFLTSDPTVAPSAMMHNIKHNKVLHQTNIILTVKTANTPRVSKDNRVRVETISDKMIRMYLNFGYMETPNVPQALGQARKLGIKFDIMTTSFFLGRRTIKTNNKSPLHSWQEHLYVTLAKEATNATDFFRIPTGRVIELGTQVTL